MLVRSLNMYFFEYVSDCLLSDSICAYSMPNPFIRFIKSHYEVSNGLKAPSMAKEVQIGLR
jgi:hypothetical protein